MMREMPSTNADSPQGASEDPVEVIVMESNEDSNVEPSAVQTIDSGWDAGASELRPVGMTRSEFSLAGEELVSPNAAIEISSTAPPQPSELIGRLPEKLSWPFWLIDRCTSFLESLLGLAVLVGALAVAVTFPLTQFIAFGYLIEMQGRIAEKGRMRDAFVGLQKASRFGRLLLGTLICWAPVFYVNSLKYGAFIIDPEGSRFQILQVVQIILMAFIVPHIVAAWFCGGRLRHFLWPMVAPWQFSVWVFQLLLAKTPIRTLLDATIGKVSPRFVADLCRVKMLTEWFLPAILWKHLISGTLYTSARDGVWDFLVALRLPTLFWLGVRAFAGTIAWLFVPILLLVGGTTLPEGPALAAGFFGILALAFVSMYLPFLQVHFGVKKKLYAMFDWWEVRSLFAKAPLLHWLGLFLLLAFSLPAYLLKIEVIERELLPILGIVFISLSLPARILVAWAYGRAQLRTRKSWFIYRWPLRLAVIPVVLAFATFVSLSRFTSWGGAAGLFELHAFLVPTPFFWIGS